MATYPSVQPRSGAPTYGQAGGRGTQVLDTLQGDPVWEAIENEFMDILGDIHDMPVEMPIAPPDMEDPQDQLRYLGELGRAGIPGGPSATMMAAGRGGMDFKDSLAMMKFLYTQQKDTMNALLKVIPNVADKDLQAQMVTQVMNMMTPGQFTTMPEPWHRWGEARTVMISPENVLDTEEYDALEESYGDAIAALIKGKDETKANTLMESIEEMIGKQFKWTPQVTQAALKELWTEASRRAATAEVEAGI